MNALRKAELLREAQATLTSIDKVMTSMRAEAAKNGFAPEDLRLMNGDWVFTPMLQAKVLLIETITRLEQM